MSDTWLTKLQQLSQSIFLFLGLFYCIGFLTVNSYLSVFGIVSFDIINARYLIAGLLSLIPVPLIVFIGWSLDRRKLAPPLREKDISQRIITLFLLPTFPLLYSTVLVVLFQIGSKHLLESSSFFQGFGSYSILNIIYPSLIKSTSLNAEFVRILVDVSLTMIVCISIYHVFKFFKKGDLFSKKLNNVSEEKKSEHINKPMSPFSLWTSRCIEAFFLAGNYALVLVSIKNLSRNTLSFATLSSHELNFTLMFSWLYLFLISYWFFTDNIIKALIKKEIREKFFSTLDSHDWFSIIFTVVIPTILLFFTFGRVIFPRIPYAIGGGEPRKVTVKTLHPSQFNTDNTSDIYLLGESSQFIYLVSVNKNSGHAYQLNKDEINTISTLTATGATLSGTGHLIP